MLDTQIFVERMSEGRKEAGQFRPVKVKVTSTC